MNRAGTRTPGSFSSMYLAPFALRSGTTPINADARSRTPCARIVSIHPASASTS